MDDRRIGLIVRALRRRRRWRQVDLAGAAGVSQSEISLIERGHLGRFSVLRAVLQPLDAAAVLSVRWRGGEIDRLLDERHASIMDAVVAELVKRGWVVRTEVTYSHYGERGSFDILAWHAATATLLIPEIKSEVTSAEATLRKLDEKERLGPIVARQRFGWRPTTVGCVLVIGESRTDRRRVERHAALFEASLPTRGRAVRQWLRQPVSPLRGLWFLSPSDRRGGKRIEPAPQRVRCRPDAHPERGTRGRGRPDADESTTRVA